MQGQPTTTSSSHAHRENTGTDTEQAHKHKHTTLTLSKARTDVRKHGSNQARRSARKNEGRHASPRAPKHTHVHTLTHPHVHSHGFIQTCMHSCRDTHSRMSQITRAIHRALSLEATDHCHRGGRSYVLATGSDGIASETGNACALVTENGHVDQERHHLHRC
jgi:hypothetical protein